MAIPKQTVSLFFGATNQDTSAKGVKLGDLTLAENVRQIKGGEWSKRGGFARVAQTYEGQPGLTPDSVVTPDGVQVLTRDAETDHVFARGATNTENQDKGHAARFVPKVQTLFPALGSSKQQAPMPKMCGKYAAYLEDAGHFRIVELNPSTAVSAGSPTRSPESIVKTSGSIGVAESGLSSTVSSFALVDYAAFDANYLWIFWVDQTNNIFALKVSHSDFGTYTFHTVYTSTESANHKKCFTSITAGLVATGLVAAACGVEIDLAANYLSPGVGGTAATGFRVAGSDPSNYGRTFSVHGAVNSSTALFSDSSETLQPFGRQVAAACTMVSAYGFQTASTHWIYAFFGVTSQASVVTGEYLPGICLIRVKASDCSFTVAEYPSVIGTPDLYGRPSDWSDTMWFMYGWFYNAQLAAKETATGAEVAMTIIPYHVTAGEHTFRAWNPDYLSTSLLRWTQSGDSWSLVWTKLGACVAQGCIRPQDNTIENPPTEAGSYLLTEWEDVDSLQPTYHVREWLTGEIVAQIAYGLGSHVGHTGTRDIQSQRYVSDVQSPMLCSWNVNAGLQGGILVGLQSENQNGSVDVAELTIQDWDYSASAKPVFQNAFPVMGMAFAPGPIPTVYNGFQRLREAGPLVYPSKPEVFLGVTSS